MTIEYNRTKCVIDIEEKLLGEYSCSRRTSCLHPGLFINMVDIGALNGFINWMPKNIEWNVEIQNNRYRFLLDLGKEVT